MGGEWWRRGTSSGIVIRNTYVRDGGGGTDINHRNSTSPKFEGN